MRNKPLRVLCPAADRPNLDRAAMGALIAAALLLLAGCQRSYAPAGARPDPIHDEAYPQVVTMYGLAGKIAMDQPVIEYADDRPMSVTVPVRHLSDGDAHVQYRFLFFGPNGKPLNDDPAWQYQLMPPRGRVYLSGAATETTAVDWQCEIRPNRVEIVPRRRRLFRR